MRKCREESLERVGIECIILKMNLTSIYRCCKHIVKFNEVAVTVNQLQFKFICGTSREIKKNTIGDFIIYNKEVILCFREL